MPVLSACNTKIEKLQYFVAAILVLNVQYYAKVNLLETIKCLWPVSKLQSDKKILHVRKCGL